jgi:hypothetical protein
MDHRRKAEAIAAARREIARRIARFCASLTPEEFDRLLDRMASVEWKYDVHPIVAESHPTLEQIQAQDRESPERPQS